MNMPTYQEVWNDMLKGVDIAQIKKIEDDGTVRYVPRDEMNTDWQEYLKWLDAGNYPYKHDEEPDVA